ncbi:MAG: FAD-dependent monooxygenase [Alphaproteobacteria bacterium]|nr:FAD-dependent monooxygenase [Alphaproteobacteria bacterium]MDX5368579.1 FAD-dependent monooxygenase [Alphaproteobacteria bacterium]MDX5463324.1 FAD-dependent monooxygenase [Alphaproteobacteria bacterium]
MPRKPASTETDVLIAGGGMAGLSLALALAQGGLSCTVVDALSPETVTDAGFDGRVSALAYAVCRMYRALGVWQHMAPHAQPINDIVVTDGTVRGGASPLFLHFDHREIGKEPLGHLVENRHIRLALFAAARDVSAITLIAPGRVTGYSATPDGVTGTLADGRQVHARLLAVCEGRQSPLRAMAGIRTIGWSYRQTGIVTTVAHEKPHHGIAQEFFLPSGPFAILPMTGNRASLVWTERTELADALLALDAEDFAAELRARFGDYLGAVEPVGPRWSYPLSLQIATDMIAERVALVGDAAHGIHPIAGQGLNLGLRDVAALAEVMAQARGLGLDPGAFDTLERYAQWRRFDTVSLAAVTDVLNRLFSNDIGPVRLVRDTGLWAAGQVAPLRRFFMRHAGGDVGDLPKLLRGDSLAG